MNTNNNTIVRRIMSIGHPVGSGWPYWIQGVSIGFKVPLLDSRRLFWFQEPALDPRCPYWSQGVPI